MPEIIYNHSSDDCLATGNSNFNNKYPRKKQKQRKIIIIKKNNNWK